MFDTRRRLGLFDGYRHHRLLLSTFTQRQEQLKQLATWYNEFFENEMRVKVQLIGLRRLHKLHESKRNNREKQKRQHIPLNEALAPHVQLLTF